MVALSPPTSEAGVRFMALPQVGKLVVGRQFTVQNLDQLHVLVSSAKHLFVEIWTKFKRVMVDMVFLATYRCGTITCKDNPVEMKYFICF